jgi:hypothetical protein
VLALACLIGGCNREKNPYLSSHNSQGTPADRTGGARNVPRIHGGGPGQDLSLAAGHKSHD